MGVANILPIEEKALAVADDGQRLIDNISMFSNNYDDENNGDSSEDNSFNYGWNDEDDDSNNHKYNDIDKRIAYWECQESLLQEILAHHLSTSSKFRREITGIIEMARETNIDSCRCFVKPKCDGGCCKCLRQRVVNLLCSKGFNATLCTSKWNHTTKCPGGTHEYIEVIVSTQSRKKQISFLIELEFRDEFKMAKACEEYHQMINQLPEMFIGKAEHLNALVRVVCDAAKRSTAEKRIHMGPWRKKSFMQKKWSASSSPSSSPSSSLTRQQHMPVFTPCLRFSSPTAAVEVL